MKTQFNLRNGRNIIQRGTEFLPTYIQMLIKYSNGYGFESLRSR